MRSWTPQGIASVAFSLLDADAAAFLPLKAEFASLPKPVSFSLLHAKLGLPPDPNLGLPSTPCGMCMHDRGTPSRGHPRVHSPGPMIGTRSDTCWELPAGAAGHPDAISARPRTESNFLVTLRGKAECGEELR